MTRKKVKVAFIENEKARKSTFKKRKRGILKKAHELATLCDVPICVLIDSAYDSIPEAWPSREEANKVLSQWEMMSAMDKTKKMVNQETYLQQRISKATESLKKLWRENKELEMQELMFSCLSGKTSVSYINKNDLPDLGCVIDQYLKDLNRNIEILRTNDVPSSSSVFGAGAGVGAATPSNVINQYIKDLNLSIEILRKNDVPSSSVFGVGAATTSNVMPMTMFELGSSSAEFYDKIRIKIENTLNKKLNNGE